MSACKPTNRRLFFSQNDPTDPRLGELAQNASLSPALKYHDGFGIIGYPDDQGISLNGGRPGASQGPSAIRKNFYRLTRPEAHRPILDFGDLAAGRPLAGKHQKAKSYVTSILKEGILLISLGGGHDYGFSDGAGFLENHKQADTQPLILNFDAHLDCRPVENENFHSGTPFRRLLQNYGSLFSLFHVGLQRHCNASAHVQWAIDQGVKILWQDQIEKVGLLPLLKMHLSQLSQKTPIFISIDMDVLSSSVAPGVSHGFASGMSLPDLLLAVEFLQGHFQLKSAGLYEVSPPLDTDDKTAKTAALILHQIYSRYSRRQET